MTARKECIERCEQILAASGINVNECLFGHPSHHGSEDDEESPESPRAGSIEALLGVMAKTKPKPLHFATLYRNPAILKVLLEAGADPNVTDRLGRSPLSILLTHWPRPSTVCPNNLAHPAHPRTVAMTDPLAILRRPDNTPNGSSTIQCQYYRRKLTECEAALGLLLKSGAWPCQSISSQLHQTPLHLAASFNLPVAIRILGNYIQSKTPVASPEKTSSHIQQQPSTSSSRFPPKQRIKRPSPLLTASAARSAPIDQPDVRGRSALVLAAAWNSIDALSELIDLGGDVRLKDVSGRSALHYACFRYHSHIYRDGASAVLLLLAGATPRVADNEGNTPLHVAARQANQQLIEILLSSGADADALNDLGRTPFYEYLNNPLNLHSPTVFQTLISACPRVNISDARSRSPYLVTNPPGWLNMDKLKQVANEVPRLETLSWYKVVNELVTKTAQIDVVARRKEARTEEKHSHFSPSKSVPIASVLSKLESMDTFVADCRKSVIDAINQLPLPCILLANLKRWHSGRYAPNCLIADAAEANQPTVAFDHIVLNNDDDPP